MKLKIKKLFILRDYHALKSLIMHDSSVKLNKIEVKKISEYALRENDEDLMFRLFSHVDYNTRRVFIKVLYQNKTYVASTALFTVFFNDFLSVGLEIKNSALLYHLAVICSKDYQNHTADTFILNGYFSECPDFNFLVAASKLDHFNNPSIKAKILNEKPDNIVEHILSLPLQEVGSFVSEYISKEPELENIEIIANILNKNEEVNIKFIHAIVNSKIRDDLKSMYLLAIFKANQNSSHHKYLIDEILKLKDYQTIKRLMNMLSKEEQNKYAIEAMNSQDLNLMLILASTTDCTETINLIEYILSTNEITLVTKLVSSLEKEFLNYTLNYIIRFKGPEFYLEMINELRKYMNNLIPAINYLIENDLLSHYDNETINYMLSLITETENKRK